VRFSVIVSDRPGGIAALCKVRRTGDITALTYLLEAEGTKKEEAVFEAGSSRRQSLWRRFPEVCDINSCQNDFDA
jgi:hypothetical protein